jgi:hypothetical protein
MSAGQELAAVASAARKVSSFAATMDIRTSGPYTSHLSGTQVEQVRPTVLSQQTFKVTEAGRNIPGRLRTLLTSNAVYLSMSTLRTAVGKPWIKIPFSAFKHMGVNLAPLIRQLQGNNPLAQAQLLAAATNVRQVGSGTVNGVPTTEYTGTVDVTKAMARIDPGLRKLIGPAMQATGITTTHFEVWVDAQHQVRRLRETGNGANYHVTTLMTVTAINQPVHITVPAASQVARMPGL